MQLWLLTLNSKQMETLERTASRMANRMTAFLRRCIPRVYLELVAMKKRSMVATRMRKEADVMAQ